MFVYADGNKTAEVKKETNLSLAEVKLFFYFLIKQKNNLNEKKMAEFQRYLDNGQMPEEMGMVTKGKRHAFCIRKMYKNSYTLYLSVKGDDAFRNRIRRILEKVKK